MLPCMIRLTPQVLDPIADVRVPFPAPQLQTFVHPRADLPACELRTPIHIELTPLSEGLEQQPTLIEANQAAIFRP